MCALWELRLSWSYSPTLLTTLIQHQKLLTLTSSKKKFSDNFNCLQKGSTFHPAHLFSLRFTALKTPYFQSFYLSLFFFIFLCLLPLFSVLPTSLYSSLSTSTSLSHTVFLFFIEVLPSHMHRNPPLMELTSHSKMLDTLPICCLYK